MKLTDYDNQTVRLTAVDGEAFEGVARTFPAEYGLREYGREEEGIRLGTSVFFAGWIKTIEPMDPKELCGFYGAESVSDEIRELYRDLKHAWCAETCAPRMRPDWSEDNPTLGQCSIAVFVVQDLLGGRVYGVPLPDGSFHCYNEVGGMTFDLTSEQFGEEKLNYVNNPEQFREVHFASEEKRARYELLKKRLEDYRAQK